jgi:hypothetical protein
MDVRPADEADTTDHMGTFASAVVLDIENLSPNTPVGVNAEEGFTESDKDRKVENGVWGQLPELNPVEEKKETEKLVGRKRETTE